MMSQESLNRLRHGVVPVEIALVGEAIDLRLGNLNQGQVDAAVLARALANRGHDTRALQAYLGHKNIQHTVRYTELSPNSVQRFLAELTAVEHVRFTHKSGYCGARPRCPLCASNGLSPTSASWLLSP